MLAPKSSLSTLIHRPLFPVFGKHVQVQGLRLPRLPLSPEPGGPVRHLDQPARMQHVGVLQGRHRKQRYGESRPSGASRGSVMKSRVEKRPSETMETHLPAPLCLSASCRPAASSRCWRRSAPPRPECPPSLAVRSMIRSVRLAPPFRSPTRTSAATTLGMRIWPCTTSSPHEDDQHVCQRRRPSNKALPQAQHLTPSRLTKGRRDAAAMIILHNCTSSRTE